MRRFWRWVFKILFVIAVLWIILTLWAERQGSKRFQKIRNNSKGLAAVIVYDPDPFYNFDQQVCEVFGNVLADSGWSVTISTVAAAKQLSDSGVGLYVFCSNTYNWAPDWAITQYIKNHSLLVDKKVVAITLGGGSTARSKEIFENIIKNKKANLIDSKTFWLWRPNDESRMNEKNTEVVIDMVKKWAEEIASKK
jgi:hypothetical protein